MINVFVNSKQFCNSSSAFGFLSKVYVAFPYGRITALSYQDVLEENLLHFNEGIGVPFLMSQQDNTFIHTQNSTLEWSVNNGVHVSS